eukprot:6124620-Lingulodinium_polyedra.AAC.1
METVAKEAARSSKTQGQEEEEKGQVNLEPEDVKKVRQSCKNTLLAVCTILSRDGLQALVRVIMTICGPIAATHGANAAQVRSPQQAVTWYTEQSQGKWLETLGQVTSHLSELSSLKFMGFSCDFGSMGKKAKATDGWVQAEDNLAHVVLELALRVLAKRSASMSWHSTGWPGLLGLLCSPHQEDVQKAIGELVDDYKTFQLATTLGKSSLFLRNLAKTSPFNTTLMQEIGDWATASADPTNDAALQSQLCALAKQIW